MGAFDSFAVDGFLDSVVQAVVSLVPAGFLLGMLCGILSFGIFSLFSLFKRILR